MIVSQKNNDMKEVSLRECKELELRILVNIADFCNKHHIKYSLAYGTLIGAIRHKGFIPWDDDIDIIMKRDEYEKFLSLYHDDYYQLIDGKHQSNQLHVRVSDMSTRLEFLASEGSKHFYKGGVWVDVFPIDKAPNKLGQYRKLKKRIFYSYRLFFMSIFTPSKSVVKKMMHGMLSLFKGVLEKNVHTLVQSYNSKQVNMMANLSLWYLDYPAFPSFYMNDYVDVEFEGYTFKAMKHYDDFLRGIYGDYMKLPPEDQRCPRHSYIAYWRE